jgi:multidrug efflux system membrane fusion protein
MACLAAGLWLCCACRPAPAPPSRSPRVPVTAATAVERTVPLQIARIGTVEAFSTIQVKAQIGGLLTRVFFQEGQEVRHGDLLFQIDPRPYEQALRQAEATLQRDEAQAAQAEANLSRDLAQARNAETQAARYSKLASQGVISKEQNDTTQTNADVYKEAARADRAAIASAHAAVVADRAAVEAARLNIEYCQIRSPINGRTGNLMVKEGNLIKANADTAMLTINQLSPIYVTFTVPQQRLAEIRSYAAARPLAVEASVSNRPKTEVARGSLTFIDNAVDESTGTIRLKGTFPNADHFLWPGQFVDVVLTLATQSNVTLVPTEAVQEGQKGQYAFVVKSDSTVESRVLKTGRTVGREIIIENGIRPGETVVTDGQLRIVPGARVQIVTNPALTAEGS